MQIYISEEAIIREIQEKFQAIYPYLKLEFYQQPHKKGEYCPAEGKVSSETPIEKIRMLHSFGWLDVNNSRTVAEVEHDFSCIFGLSAQVFRKAETMWLETTGKDNWTLEALNNTGTPLNK